MLTESVIALDVGDARIGLAVGRPGSGFAFGRGYLTRGTLEEDVRAIEDLLRREGAGLAIIGLPKHQDGGDSAQTRKVRDFAEALNAHGIETVFEDERYTTKLAGQGLKKSGASRKRRREKGRLDEASAVLILESFLSKHRERVK